MRPKKAAERKPEVVEGADKKKRKAATLRVMVHVRGRPAEEKKKRCKKSGILDRMYCILDFSREGEEGGGWITMRDFFLKMYLR